MSIIKKKFIFNISTTRVSGAVTHFDEKNNISVIDFFTEKHVNLKDNFSLVDFRKETLIAIDGVCQEFIKFNKLYNDNNMFVEDAEVFLNSPWVEYENYSITDESLTPFFTGEKYLNNFLIKKQNFPDREILNSDITSVKANDYDINMLDLPDKQIQKLSISFLDSFFKKFDKHFIDGAIRNHFSLIKINFNSFLPVLFNQIRKIYDPKDDFVFLDISKEVTELGIFQNGEVKYLATIPFGLNKVIVSIKKKLSVDSPTAISYLKLFFEKHLDDDITISVRKIIVEQISSIRDELIRLSGDELPENAFLISSYWKTNKIIKESGLFNNLYFINSNILENYIRFDCDAWDNFIAIETEYAYDKEFLGLNSEPKTF